MNINRNLVYTITKKEEGLSIKQFLLSIDISPSYAIRLRNSNQVLKNNKIEPFWTPLKLGDTVTINPYLLRPSTVDPISMSLNILYEDRDFIALEKPYDVPTHPTARHLKDTMANGVAAYFEKKDWLLMYGQSIV